MSKTAKIFFGIVAFVVAAVAIGLFWSLTHLDGIVKSAIEKVGPQVTGTPVRVTAVHVSLQDGTGEITGLTIANPEGFDSDYAIRFGKVYLSLDKASLTTDVVRINAITVQESSIIAEVKAGSGINLQKIMDNMKGDDSGASERNENKSGNRLIVERFDLTNSDIKLVTGIKDYEATMGDIHVTGIGEESNGATGREVALQLLRPVISEAIRAARKEGSKHGIDGLRESLTDRLKDKIGIGD
ncbi:MAG: hypothetical protein ACR2QU_12840 [Gammaproteobacteria bacterium]